MSLPASWIEKIFTKLTLVYGRDFLSRWEGLNIDDVKSDWGHELDGFQNFPEGIAHALTHLPSSKAPTVMEFREIARKAPLPEFKALPSPKASPQVVAEQLARLAPLKKIMTRPGDKAWAPQIIARHEGGEQISPTVLKFAQAVAGVKA